MIAPLVQLDVDTVVNMIELPPQADLGDLAFPCFVLAKTLKKAPQVLATEIAAQVAENLPAQFAKIIAVGPYINAFIDTARYTGAVLTDAIVGNKTISDRARATKILLEYMSGNPNKPLHVGHARNVCIGDTLRRSFSAAGYDIQTSHYGDDSGVNVGYNIVGHLFYDILLDPGMNAHGEPKKFDHYCGEVYLKMRGMDEDPEFKDRLSKTLHAIEHNSDPAIMKLHKDYVKQCTIEQLRTCWRVGAGFNIINWETDILHLDLFAEALGILKDRGHVVFVDDAFITNGWEKFADAKWCWVIDLSSLPAFAKEEKQYAILVKSDGVATYVAKDIAFAMWKLGYLQKQFHFFNFVQQPDVDGNNVGGIAHGSHPIYSTTSDETIGENIAFGDYNQAITIIDNRQIPAQTVVRSWLELLGLLGKNDVWQEKEYTPLGYGVVYLTPNTLLKAWFTLTDEEKSMTRLPFASRKWWTVTMDDMLDALHARAYEESQKRNTDADSAVLHDTAENIAISAFRFFLTKTDILKDITFDIDEVLDMEGETGAYVLYTNARIKAVIQKALTEDTTIDATMFDGQWADTHNLVSWYAALLTHPLEAQLVKKIDELDGVVAQVIDELAPHLLNRYLISVCQLFNSYYNDVHIGKSEHDVKVARLYLLKIFGKTLEKAMWLLGMKPVERM